MSLAKYKNKRVFMSDRKLLSGTREGRNHEIDATVLE
jgi:hypothetical protein